MYYVTRRNSVVSRFSLYPRCYSDCKDVSTDSYSIAQYTVNEKTVKHALTRCYSNCRVSYDFCTMQCYSNCKHYVMFCEQNVTVIRSFIQ